MTSRVMGKLKDIFTNTKELPQWVLPFIMFFWIYLEITEYGHRPFTQGFVELITDPVLYYIIVGGGILGFLILYLVKKNKKNRVDEDDEVDKSVKEEKSTSGGETFGIIVFIIIIIIGYFSNRYSKETEKRVEDFMEQKKMEQIDPQTQE